MFASAVFILPALLLVDSVSACYNANDAKRDGMVVCPGDVDTHCDFSVPGIAECYCKWGCYSPSGAFLQGYCKGRGGGWCTIPVGWNAWCEDNKVCKRNGDDGEVLECKANHHGNARPTCCRVVEEPDKDGYCKPAVDWNAWCDGNKICKDTDSGLGKALTCKANHHGNARPTCCRNDEEPDKDGYCKAPVDWNAWCDGNKICKATDGAGKALTCKANHHGNARPTCCRVGEEPDSHGSCKKVVGYNELCDNGVQICSSGLSCRIGRASQAVCCSGNEVPDETGRCSSTGCRHDEKDCHGTCIASNAACCASGQKDCHGTCIPAGEPCSDKCRPGKSICGTNPVTGHHGIITCSQSRTWEYAHDCPNNEVCRLRGAPPDLEPYCVPAAQLGVLVDLLQPTHLLTEEGSWLHSEVGANNTRLPAGKA